VSLGQFDSECHLVAWILDALRDLEERDPQASIALICQHEEAARRLAALLRRGTLVRLALDGEFHFRAGVHVTCVQEVKGLEFDYVIVPDASPAAWPDAPQSRRALYVAATRAMQQLVFVSPRAFSPLLRAAG
jgi:DNA helicase IV